MRRSRVSREASVGALASLPSPSTASMPSLWTSAGASASDSISRSRVSKLAMVPVSSCNPDGAASLCGVGFVLGLGMDPPHSEDRVGQVAIAMGAACEGMEGFRGGCSGPPP